MFQELDGVYLENQYDQDLTNVISEEEFEMTDFHPVVFPEGSNTFSIVF